MASDCSARSAGSAGSAGSRRPQPEHPSRRLSRVSVRPSMGGNSPGGIAHRRRRTQPYPRQTATRTYRWALCAAAAFGCAFLLWLLIYGAPGYSDSGGSCSLVTVSGVAGSQGLADPRDAIPGVARYRGAPPEHPERYTVLLNSYRRPDLLRRSLEHYSRCQEADAIRVIWSESDVQPPPSDALDGSFQAAASGGGSGMQRGKGDRAAVPVAYDMQLDASLNNRFRPLPGLRTAAVLSIDDDIIVPCAEVSAAFAAWRRRPVAMVGWFPRGVAPRRSRGSQSAGCGRGYNYLSRDQSVLLRGSYSMVLSKGAFLHRDYLRHYTEAMPAGVHAHVDTHRNCEDIAMAFLVANVTGAPPEYVRSPQLRDLGQGILKASFTVSRSEAIH